MFKKRFRYYDYSIVITVLLLSCFGLLMVFSSSSLIVKPYNLYFHKQLMWLSIGLVVGFFGMVIPYKKYKKAIKFFTIGSLALLCFVLVSGHSANGATSWITFHGMSIQPSEIAKLVVIMYLASVFENKQGFISDFRTGVLPPLIMILIFFALIYKQPDLGSAMVLAGAAGAVILCSGMRLKHLTLLFSLAVGGVLFMFFFLINKNQASRFADAYHPFAHATHGGYQLINSYIAIASGGITGRGLGQSIEKAGYLPEAYNDFIMSIVAEELGLIGVAFVIFGISYIVLRGILIGIKCHDVFGSLLAIGISSLIGIQTLVNLGVMTGLLPVTGVTLPFISYGGSSLVMLMFSVGILINVSGFTNMKRSQQKQKGEGK